jgi:predicted small integral membrane protein
MPLINRWDVEVTDISLIVSQAVVTFGFALWSSIAVINNIHDFKGSVSGVGRTMGMRLLYEHPEIPTPLKSRRVSNPLWSRIAVGAIIFLELAIAVLLWAGGAMFIFAEPSVAKAIATLGFAGLSGLCFIFLLSGMWFAYGIRQDILQITHIGLLVTSIAASVMMQL